MRSNEMVNGKCVKCYARLSICSFAFAVGITNGLCMMLFAYMGMMHWVGDEMIKLVATMYHGYAPTAIGGLFGLGWGFLDGFIFGGLIAIFYNCIKCCCCKCKCASKE